MTDYHPEHLLISALLNTEDVLRGEELGITTGHIHEYKAEYEWLTDYKIKYRKEPSLSAFKAVFPRYEVTDHADVEYAVDQVKRYHLKWSVAKTLREASSHIKDDEPEEALDHLASQVMKISQGVDAANTITSSIADFSESFEWALLRSTSEVAVGAPFAHPTIQERTLGMQGGDLWLKAARLGQGKALRNGTGVLTPSGYVPIESLMVGDKVIGSSGKPCKVIGVYPQGLKQVFNVKFSDGSVIQTCEEHLWTVRVGLKPWQVMTTGQISKKQGQKVAVPTLSCPVQYQETKSHLFDPYKLGLLLGDGCFRGNGTISFTSTDKELIEVWGRNATFWSGCNYGIARLVPTIKALGLYGTTSHTKFIPLEYLTGSVRTRHALIQGLMDTDGSVTGTGGAEFFSMSLRLAEGLQHLVESLGGFTHWHQSKGGYRLIVVLPPQFNPFRLKRKADTYVPRTKYQPVRTIVEVQATSEYEEMTCIAVSAPDSLFVTEHCIVTHNTWDLINDACASLNIGKKVLFFSLEMNKRQMEYRFQTVLGRQHGHSVTNDQLTKGRGLDLIEYKAMLNDLSGKVPGQLLICDRRRGRVTARTVAALTNKHEPDLVVIDYLSLMSPAGSNKFSQSWESIASIVDEVKEVACQFDVPILSAAQINREGERGSWRPPKAVHLAGSDSLGRDADCVITEKRFGKGAMVYSLEKNRHGQSGDVWFARFNPNFGEFHEITREQAELLREREGDFEDDL